MEHNEKPLVLIGTPAYGGMMHIDYVKSQIEFTQAGISFLMYGIGNESLITRGRNQILSYFINHPEYTHMMYLDADMYLGGADFVKLVNSGKDVCGAMVRLKSKEKLFNIHGLSKKEGNLIKVDHLGSAVMMISRKAAQDLAKYMEDKTEAINTGIDKLKDIDEKWAKDLIIELDGKGYLYDKKSSSVINDNEENNTQYDICNVGVHKGIYLSEDYYLCKYLRDLGYEIWVDTSIKTIHNGVISLDNNEETYGG